MGTSKFILLLSGIVILAGNGFCKSDQGNEKYSGPTEAAKFKLPGFALKAKAGGDGTISYTSKAFYLNVTPSSSYIYNDDIFSDNRWDIKKGVGINFEVGYLNKFNRMLGIGFGLGNSSYSTEITAAPFDYKVTATDVDGDQYTKMISFSGISEKTLINYLDVPVYLELGNTNINKIGFYARAGVKASFAYSSSLTSSGRSSYEGYYPQYHVVLSGIPELGFSADSSIYQNAEISTNPVNLSAFVSVGLTYPISNFLIFRLGANAGFGLMEISSQKANDYDQTKYDGNYNKLLGDPNATTSVRSMGIEVGLIYNLRLY